MGTRNGTNERHGFLPIEGETTGLLRRHVPGLAEAVLALLKLVVAMADRIPLPPLGRGLTFSKLRLGAYGRLGLAGS
jgi:hypothetical protein